MQKPPTPPKKEEIVEKKDPAGKVQERRKSGQEGEMEEADFVPVVKEAVIGKISLLGRVSRIF